MILRVYDYALRVSYTRRRLRTMRKPTYDVVLVISNSPRARIYIYTLAYRGQDSPGKILISPSHQFVGKSTVR
jgi:hypothetical protein